MLVAYGSSVYEMPKQVRGLSDSKIIELIVEADESGDRYRTRAFTSAKPLRTVHGFPLVLDRSY
jgi:hypothetical protein